MLKLKGLEALVFGGFEMVLMGWFRTPFDGFIFFFKIEQGAVLVFSDSSCTSIDFFASQR